MKVLDKEGLQYTLQRMVTLLTAIQVKLNTTYPECKQGVWKPRLFNTPTNEIKNVSDSYGLYYTIGDIVFIEGTIITPSYYACESIRGLPFEPYYGCILNRYPVNIVGSISPKGDNGGILAGYNDSILAGYNAIGGTSKEDGFNVYNSAYKPGDTYKRWDVYGWYRVKPE